MSFFFTSNQNTYWERFFSTLNDFNHIQTISDVASGGLSSRNGIEELKTLVETNRVDVILIWNVSRAFRSMIYFAEFYKYLKEYNVELISVSEGIRSSRKEGEMMFGIMSSIAGYEKELIRERMMSGRITKVKNGIRGYGSQIPFGYIKDEKGNIIKDEASSKIVAYIFKKMNSLLKRSNLTKRKKTSTLLKYLKSNGYKYHDKDFTRWNIRDILNNRFYIGELKYGKIQSKHNYSSIVSKRLFNQIQVAIG